MPHQLHRISKRAGIQTLGLILSACICLSCSRTTQFSKPKWHDDLVAVIKVDDVSSVERIYSVNSLQPDALLNVNSVTPLMLASFYGSQNVAKWLLVRGAKANARTVLKDPDKFPTVGDCTALHMAGARNHLEVARLLVEHGADLSQKDGNGNTAFILACAKGHLETIKLLIEHGAKTDAPNGDGWTPLLVAADRGQSAVAEFLIAQAADINAGYPGGRTVLMKASERGNEALVRLLIEKGASVNHTNFDGANAIMDAAVEGHAGVVTLLIQKGAELDQQNDEGWTALMKAAAHGHCETVTVLCEAGAEPTRTNKFEHTALDYAKGLAGTNVLMKHTDLRPLIDNGAIAQEDLYYVMLRIGSEGNFDCVTKVLENYVKHRQQKPKNFIEAIKEPHL